LHIRINEFYKKYNCGIVGLGIAGLIITLGIRAFPQWVTFEAFAPFEHWQRFLFSMKDDKAFFGFLLFISGLGTTIGGVATAIIVKYAKVAYAILIGFIMLLLLCWMLLYFLTILHFIRSLSSLPFSVFMDRR
jgi:hypothetical protein